MKLPGRRFWHLSGVVAAASTFLVTFSGHGAWSQAARTVKIVVAAPPGGATDVMARLLAEQIGRTGWPTLVIENRTGAAGAIGAEAVARAAPDGNTLLITTPGFVINPHLRKLNYDPVTSFEPICHLVSPPMVIVVNSASPYRTLAGLLNAARAKPGELTLAATGPGSVFQIAFELLERAANVNMTFVPYSGSAPANNALLGGHVTSALSDISVLEQLKAGKLRALATASRMRIESLPEVPTVAESGYKAFEVDIWYGVVAPAKTPKEMIAEIAGWFSVALQEPETKRKLVAQGLFPVGTCGADFGAFLRKQYDEFGRVIRESNIKAE